MRNSLEFTEADLPRELTQPEVVAAKVRELFDGQTPVKIADAARALGMMTGKPVEIVAAGKPRTVTILAYSGNLINVSGWGPVVIDIAGRDLSASYVGILADYDVTTPVHCRARVGAGARRDVDR